MAQRDWFTEAFGRAFTDIREKVVEEPWFGRPLSRPSGHAQSHRDVTLAEAAKEPMNEHEQASDLHEHGIDR